MKVHSQQLFNYLKKNFNIEPTEEQKLDILEIICFGNNDRGKYVLQREKSYGG